MLNLLCSSLIAVCVATLTEGQEPQASSAASATAQKSPAIEEFAWLAGHWRGAGWGGMCEEIWRRPLAGTMMGSFRLVVDDEVVFYEIMVLGPDEEGMALKVKHFSKDFVAWEDKEGAVRFGLESVKPDEASFSGLTMKRDGDKLDLSISMRSSDGSIRWEPIAFRRSSPDGVEKK